MGLLDRRRRPRPRLDPLAPLVETSLKVVRDDGSFLTEDGSTIHSLGYALLDPIGELTQVGEDDWLRASGCQLCKVAGLTHHAQSAQDEGFAPGSVVLLCPEPRNPVDPSAIGVWSKSGEQQAGFVPAELAPAIAERIASGQLLGGIILREYRTEPRSGRRLGLMMLIAPMGKVTLRVEPLPDAGRPPAEPGVEEHGSATDPAPEAGEEGGGRGL